MPCKQLCRFIGYLRIHWISKDTKLSEVKGYGKICHGKLFNIFAHHLDWVDKPATAVLCIESSCLISLKKTPPLSIRICTLFLTKSKSQVFDLFQYLRHASASSPHLFINVNFRSSKQHAHLDDCWEGRRTPLRNKQINASKETCYTYSLYDTCVYVPMINCACILQSTMIRCPSEPNRSCEWSKYDQQVLEKNCIPTLMFAWNVLPLYESWL